MRSTWLPWLADAAQWVTFVVLSPLVLGWSRWIEDRMQGRAGPRVSQPYHDLRKLFGSRPTLPEHVSTVFLASPVIVFTCALLLGAALPPPLGHDAGRIDLLLAIGITGLAKFAVTLAAFDSGSPIAVMSSGRQWFLHVLMEPTLVLAVYFAAIAGVVGGAGDRATSHTPLDALVVGAVGVALLAETSRLPFDRHGGHLELTMIEEGPGLDHGGPALGLLRWAEAMRLTFALALLARLITSPLVGAGHPLWSLVGFVSALPPLLLGLAVWESSWARLRPRSALTLFAGTAGLVLFSLVALAVASITRTGAP